MSATTMSPSVRAAVAAPGTDEAARCRRCSCGTTTLRRAPADGSTPTIDVRPRSRTRTTRALDTAAPARALQLAPARGRRACAGRTPVRRDVDVVRLAVVGDAEREAVRVDGQPAGDEARAGERRPAVAAGAHESGRARLERGERSRAGRSLLTRHPGGAEEVGLADGLPRFVSGGEQPRVERARASGPARRVWSSCVSASLGEDGRRDHGGPQPVAIADGGLGHVAGHDDLVAMRQTSLRSS